MGRPARIRSDMIESCSSGVVGVVTDSSHQNEHRNSFILLNQLETSELSASGPWALDHSPSYPAIHQSLQGESEKLPRHGASLVHSN